MIISVKLTVFFDNPFWIGIFEIQEKEQYKVCKVTFGAEPKDGEIYEFILKNYYKINFKKIQVNEDKHDKKIQVNEDNHVKKGKINPKRMQREIRKVIEHKGIGTKAQIAIKKQHEEIKIESKKRSREDKEAEQKRIFEIRKNKRKEKHKGH